MLHTNGLRMCVIIGKSSAHLFNIYEMSLNIVSVSEVNCLIKNSREWKRDPDEGTAVYSRYNIKLTCHYWNDNFPIRAFYSLYNLLLLVTANSIFYFIQKQLTYTQQAVFWWNEEKMGKKYIVYCLCVC